MPSLCLLLIRYIFFFNFYKNRKRYRDEDIEWFWCPNSNGTLADLNTRIPNTFQMVFRFQTPFLT